MALNYSHRPIFPAHTAEDNLVSPMRIVNGYLVEGVPERNGEGFTRPRYMNREIDNRARVDRCGSPESMSNDVIDLLPSDPFGMDISSTVTAITGWLEDLEVDYGAFGRSNGVGASKEEYKHDVFADWKWIWNSAMRFQSFPGNNIWFDEKLKNIEGNRHNEKKNLGDGMVQYGSTSLNQHDDALAPYGSGSLSRHEEKDFGDALAQYGSRSLNHHDVKKDLGDGFARCGSGSSRDVGDIPGSSGENTQEKADDGSEGNFRHGDSHQALDYAIRYLGLKDLLSVERVCRHWYTNVRSDNSLWRSIHIDHPLNEKITDDILLQLTNKAEGNLQCLSLVECQRVTDDGVRRVLETNPRLTKLCVPGCTRISIAAIVNNVKAFNSKKGTLGIKHLRIGGLYCITQEHFEELMFLLGTDRSIQQSGHKPRFYHLGNLNLLRDDDRAIDVETCPRCEQPRILYDCPAEGCQTKDHTAQICRACTLCIPRCAECGRCVNDNEYEETFNLDLLCSDCSLAGTEVSDKSDSSVGPT